MKELSFILKIVYVIMNALSEEIDYDQ